MKRWIALGIVASALGVASLAHAQRRADRPAAQGQARAVPAARDQARAVGPVAGEVLVVLAAELPGVIDPRLVNVPALRRPPFDSYGSMALLSSPQVQLVVGREQVVELPNGRRIRLVLREITRDGRYRMHVSINRPGQQDYLPELNVVASPGDPFFIAGQAHQGGTLVIGIRLGVRSPG